MIDGSVPQKHAAVKITVITKTNITTFNQLGVALATSEKSKSLSNAGKSLNIDISSLFSFDAGDPKEVPDL